MKSSALDSSLDLAENNLTKICPPGIKQKYTDFILLDQSPSQTSYYKTYQAKSCKNSFSSTIRIFDTQSDFVKSNYDSAITLFFQEMIYLCLKLGGNDQIHAKIEDFEYFQGQVAFVLTKEHLPLSKITKSVKRITSSASIDVEAMLRSVAKDLKYLSNNMSISNLNIRPENIYQVQESCTYYLANWMPQKTSAFDLYNNSGIRERDLSHALEEIKNALQSGRYLAPELRDLTLSSNCNSTDSSMSLSSSVYSLGLVGLEVCGIEDSKVQALAAIKDSTFYTICLEHINKMLKDLKYSDSLRKLITNMVCLDYQDRITLEGIVDTKNMSNNANLNSSLRSANARAAHINYRLLWCSFAMNKIENYDPITNTIAETQGALAKEGWRSLLVSVPNSDYVISSNCWLHHSKALFEVFDVSRNMNKVFSLPETDANVFDIACNSRTNRAALLSIPQKTSYHLFDCFDWDSPPQKMSWKPQCKGAWIVGLDFNSDGDKIAMIDNTGVFVFCDVATDSQIFNLRIAETNTYVNKCRMNPNIPLAAISFGNSQGSLALVDTYKKELLSNDPLRLAKKCVWMISWHKDANLLACCTDEGAVKIYDIREGTVVQASDDWYSKRPIHSLAWSPSGNEVAITGREGSVKIADLRSGKVMSSWEVAGGVAGNSVCFKRA